MDISGLGSMSASLGQAQSGDAVAITVLKKALDIEAQSALQLLQALPQPAANNPPSMGNSIDTFA